MKKLITVTNKDIISAFQDNQNINLLYPLKNYCCGYELEFNIDDINSFCLVNRILNDTELDNLKMILESSKIKGIVFDDLGIIEIIKDLNITKILLLDHIATSTNSINYYLDYVDSVVVSNDLSEEEIRNIVNCVKKPVVLNVFGLKTLMYSRRNLISNYQKHHKLDEGNIIEPSIESKYFKVIENDYGTKFYAWPYYNATSLLDLENVLYFWYDPIFLSLEQLKKVLNNDFSDIPNSRIFLDTKTIYKVGDIDA